MEDIGFMFKDPEPSIFLFWQWACGAVKVCISQNPVHLSQAALADECPWFLPRLTFWASPFDGCPEICRVQHNSTRTGNGWFFISELWPTQGELSSLFNINFLKYVPNSTYKREHNTFLSLYVPPCHVYNFSLWWLLLAFCTVVSKQTWWPPIFFRVFESMCSKWHFLKNCIKLI